LLEAAENKLTIDPDGSSGTEEETISLLLSPATKFFDKRKKPLDRALIRPGLTVEVEDILRQEDYLVARSVVVTTGLEPEPRKLDGFLDKIEPNGAIVDGQRVQLSSGARVAGEKDWKRQVFESLSSLEAGCELELNGLRKPEGIVVADRGKAGPRLMTELDRELIKQVQSNYSAPASALAGGTIRIAERQFKLAQSLDMQAYVTRVGYKLVPAYAKEVPAGDPRKITFRFYVVEDDNFNAFALPDGSVFVHTGLLKVIENEAQLAAVMGHEIAHITYKHPSKRYQTMVKAMMIGGIAAAVAGAATRRALPAVLIGFGVGIMSNKFGRTQEDQADRLGLFYMQEAGYDPREAPRLWKRVMAKMPRSPLDNSVLNFIYSDHSSARARFKNLNREIAYNYSRLDLSSTITGEQKYRQLVWSYLGIAPASPPAGKGPPAVTVVQPPPLPPGSPVNAALIPEPPSPRPVSSATPPSVAPVQAQPPVQPVSPPAPPAVSLPVLHPPVDRMESARQLGWLQASPKYKNLDGTPKTHLGVDFAATYGDPVYAVADGEIVFRRTDVTNFGGDGLPGGALVIKHSLPDGKVFHALYGHLEDPITGERVSAGQLIATVGHFFLVGKGSFDDKPHLHFGVHEGDAMPLEPFLSFSRNQRGAVGWANPSSWLDKTKN
jgi:murein DD-endopeptidase MepM/ murein hydrolase activator NlpD